MKLLALLLLAPALCLAEPATVIRATEMKQQPATDAAAAGQLAESAKVDALERKGGWTRVKAEGGAEGWVRMLALRYAGAGEAKQGDAGIALMFKTHPAPGERLYALEKMQLTLDAYAGQPQLVDRFAGAARR
jgi:hypothetical protein